MALFKGVIFDIDGVLEYQGKVYEGAVELIRLLRDNDIKVRFLTNSTLKSQKSAAERLRNKGFIVFDEEVITASYATAVYLREINPKSCWVLVEREGINEFKGFKIDEENPEYIVIGDNRSKFDFYNMNRALRLLTKGSKLIGMISELIDSSLGELELNVGSWVKMLEEAACVKAVYIGKPNPYMFELTLKTMSDLKKEGILMVGDRVSSDILGAKSVGIKSMLIKQGEFNKNDLNNKIQPDYTGASIKDIEKVVFKTGF